METAKDLIIGVPIVLLFFGSLAAMLGVFGTTAAIVAAIVVLTAIVIVLGYTLGHEIRHGDSGY